VSVYTVCVCVCVCARAYVYVCEQVCACNTILHTYTQRVLLIALCIRVNAFV